MSKVKAKPLGLYESGYKQGYKDGAQNTFKEEAEKQYFRGVNDGREHTIEVCIQSIVLALYHEGCDAEQLERLSKEMVEAIHYNANHPVELKRLLEEMKEDIDFEAIFSR